MNRSMTKKITEWPSLLPRFRLNSLYASEHSRFQTGTFRSSTKIRPLEMLNFSILRQSSNHTNMFKVKIVSHQKYDASLLL